MDLEKFRNDVYEVTDKLSENLKETDLPKLHYVRQQLIDPYQKNLVKINHSVLELICASNLIVRGHSVDVEKQISDILVCDIFAKKGGGSTIVEIETGFTPPDHAMDTIDYFTARIMSKIARYSQHCSKFSLATPVIGLIPIPKTFLIPPNARNELDVNFTNVRFGNVLQLIYCTNDTTEYARDNSSQGRVSKHNIINPA